jgi:hypothetical protein
MSWKRLMEVTAVRYWVTLPPRPGEDILCVKTGAVPLPGTEFGLIGGLLILTSERFYQGPLDLRLWGRLRATMTKTGGSLLGINTATGWLSKARAVELRDIVDVQPIRRASLRITTRDGRRRDFGIAAGMFVPVWSKKNPPHRDQLVHAIHQALPRT